MAIIEITPRKKYELKIEGKVYEVLEPTHDDQVIYEKSVVEVKEKENHTDELSNLARDFLVKLGMPMEVLVTLSTRAFVQILEVISAVEKKN